MSMSSSLSFNDAKLCEGLWYLRNLFSIFSRASLSCGSGTQTKLSTTPAEHCAYCAVLCSPSALNVDFTGCVNCTYNVWSTDSFEV